MLVGVARESDSFSQLMGSAPQQDGRTSGIGGRTEARLTPHTGATSLRGRPSKSQCTTVNGGGSPPSSPDRGVPDSDGYSSASEITECQHRCRGHRGSRERKWLAPARLDMPIFKLTDPGAEVTYTLWRFDVDAFLEQYDEASMCPHIFASLHGYPGKWACTLDKGKDISVWDLLMYMEKTFSNKHDYDAMTRTMYEVQQRDDEMVEEYMLCIHEAVVVICRVYLDCLPDRGWNLRKDRFYHGLRPYLHDALSFAMAELPKREQARPTFDTLYTLAKKLEAGQLAHTCQYTTSSEVYRDKNRHYLVPVAQGYPHHEAFRQWHRDQANSKGVGESSSPTPGAVRFRPEVNVHIIGRVQNPRLEVGGPTVHWLGPETLVELTVEGRNFTALVVSGSQVNTIMPTLVQQYGFPVLPLEDLMDYPLNLMGLGGTCTSPLGFVILRIQVWSIAGYDEDTVFLVVPNESDFRRRVPLVVGTCTIGRMINII